ncbi:MAG: hypothetical protein RR365_11945 [Bacteroides sp.]
MSTTIDLGAVTAYALAVAAGYKGTAEAFATDLANSAKNAATATERATAAGTSATEAAASAKRADDIVKSITLNKYSVRFTGAASAGVREDSAIGMVANVATGGAVVKNDFDRVSFFDRPICCCTRSVTAKSGWIVNAYRGEPGFAADGTNGEVMYECKPFYYKASPDLTFVSVSGTPMEAYQLAPMFKDGETKVYCPSYWMGNVGGKATSRSGDIPSPGGPNSLTALARTFDAGAFLEPMTVRFSDYLLQLVEFADRNLKAVMAGAQVMRYNGEFDKIVSVVSTTVFTTTAAVGGAFVDGQSISIGSARNGSDRIYNVKINTIVTAGDVSTFTLNVPVPTMAAGDFISTRCWQNGATDVVVASSGSPVSNSDGKHPCIWRGKVDPWAHCWSTLADVLVKREGLGTAENPYTYVPYFLPDPKKYANGAITADYVRCNTVLPPTSGYVKALAQDSRYPAAFGPAELGAASNTYVSSYFYNYGYEVAGLVVGGSWNGGGGCSPVCFFCCPPSAGDISILGRLFVLPE